MKPSNNQQLMNYDDCYQSTWGRNYNIQPIRAMRYHFVKKALRGLAGSFPIKRALDVGCGIGDIANFVRALWKDIKVTGIDVSKEAVDLAKRNNPDIDFLVSDLESFKTEKGYDLITAIDVIEHIENDKIALTRMRHLLQDNGILLMSLPHSMRYWTKSDETGGHYRRYSKRETADKLKEAGFSIIKLRSYGFPFPVLYLYFKNWLNKSQQCNEDELVKEPTFIIRIAVSIIKYLFFTCEVDIGLGLHLLVIAQKLPRTN
jgi:2-polyprenyl-3-methyl-5-hydroxy-6-metoxy-1,4-benzoquinol methylase